MAREREIQSSLKLAHAEVNKKAAETTAAVVSARREHAACKCQLDEERRGRDTAERREEQLKAWLMELRLDRRRLEDRILEGGSTHVQEQRAALEANVQQLTDAKITLQSELATLERSRINARQLQVRVIWAMSH